MLQSLLYRVNMYLWAKMQPSTKQCWFHDLIINVLHQFVATSLQCGVYISHIRGINRPQIMCVQFQRIGTKTLSQQKRNTDLQQEEPMLKFPWGQVLFCSHVFPVYSWVLPRYSSFLPHSKDIHLVLGKLTLAVMICVNHCIFMC